MLRYVAFFTNFAVASKSFMSLCSSWPVADMQNAVPIYAQVRLWSADLHRGTRFFVVRRRSAVIVCIIDGHHRYQLLHAFHTKVHTAASVSTYNFLLFHICSVSRGDPNREIIVVVSPRVSTHETNRHLSGATLASLNIARELFYY